MVSGKPKLLGVHAAGRCEADSDQGIGLPVRCGEKASRLPAGHPEAFIEAFANIYVGVAEAIHARIEGRELQPLEGDFPTLEDGVRGVRFIEKTVESSKSTQKWTGF